MKLRIALLLALVAAPLHAETLMVGDQMQVRETSVEVPGRGMSMSQVESKYGAPRARHSAVGEPPITRWDYEAFSVYFEHSHVIHSVVPASPPVVDVPATAGQQ